MRSGSKTQGTVYLATPAKVTPVLRVLGKRPDGYHEVAIALLPVSLYDALELATGGAPGIELAVESAQSLGAPEGNLVYRAARAFEDALGRPLSVRMRLRKHIPAGAGLGGGSGNAAGTLVALNRLHGNPLPDERLQALAAALGSDVPFFLAPRPSWATGRGERLAPLADVPVLPLVVVVPPLAIGTGEAYGLVEPVADARGAPRLDSVVAVLRRLENAFEPALLPRYPVLGRIRAALGGAGAPGILLSGSGSAVFGVFPDEAAQTRAVRHLEAQAAAEGWRVLPCHTLSTHTYA